MNQGGVFSGGGLLVLAIVGFLWYGNHQTATQNHKVQVNLSSIYMGEPLQDVLATLGTPDNRQHSESSFEGVTDVSDYLYYGDWQLGFDNGKLDSRSKY
jgi:hypothetical protein